MTIRSKYLQTMKACGFRPDSAQLTAIDSLAGMHAGLVAAGSPGHWSARVARSVLGSFARGKPVKGIYLWGGVGRGKTFLMDMFFDELPFDDKLRFHFHRLMYRVHSRLKSLPASEDPIQQVAEEFAAQARVICFDEFFVSDIADAMILGRLLSALFDRHVALVTTSNVAPDDLYKDGLQRSRFLPALDLIKNNCEQVHVDGPDDYRLLVLKRSEIYHSPLDNDADLRLDRCFEAIAPDQGTAGLAIEILGRDIRTRRRADGVAWFEFSDLCDGPRSQDDYIEISRCFQTVIVSDIPVLDASLENPARRFVALVDEFYDRRVKLIVSAAAPIDELYQGRRLALEFERTRSRLLEMQSAQYLALAHLP